MQEASELIVQLGFPITACLLLGYFIFYMWKSTRDDNNKREETEVFKNEQTKIL